MARTLVATLSESVPDGAILKCSESGQLEFQSDRDDWDPADGPSSVSVDSIITVSEIAGRTADDLRVFMLHAATCDADGHVWEHDFIVDVFTLWTWATRNSTWMLHFADWRDDPQLRRASNVVRRTIIGPLATLCDNRDDVYITAVRPSLDWRDHPSDLPYERGQKVLFKLRFKYFGAAFSVMEETVTYPGQSRAARPQLFLIMRSHTGTQSIATLDARDRLIDAPPIDPLNIGAFQIPLYGMSGQWADARHGMAKRGSRDEWRAVLQGAGHAVDQCAALQQNPGIRFVKSDRANGSC